MCLWGILIRDGWWFVDEVLLLVFNRAEWHLAWPLNGLSFDFHRMSIKSKLKQGPREWRTARVMLGWVVGLQQVFMRYLNIDPSRRVCDCKWEREIIINSSVKIKPYRFVVCYQKKCVCRSVCNFIANQMDWRSPYLYLGLCRLIYRELIAGGHQIVWQFDRRRPPHSSSSKQWHIGQCYWMTYGRRRRRHIVGRLGQSIR